MGVLSERLTARRPLRLPRWSALTLSVQFLLAGSVVLIVGMLAIGLWVSKKIEEGVAQSTAAATALYMQSMVTPLVQNLAQTDRPDPESQAKLDALLTGTALGKQIVSFKIWKEGGLVVYSTSPSIIGKRFPVTPNLRDAWRGAVAAEFDSLHDEEDALERRHAIPLLEMYVPIRETNSPRIIEIGRAHV